MADEIPVTLFVTSDATQTVERLAVEEPALPLLQEPSLEEKQAVEAVFAQQQESHLVAGLLGLWTSAQVMRDIAVDTFTSTEEEEPRRKKKKKADEPSA